MALADAITLPEPDGGIGRLRWRIDMYQREHAWLGLPIGVLKKFSEDGGGKLAALIAYFGLFSIFPLMLAFTSIIGFVIPDPADQQRFGDAAANQIPVVGTVVKQQAGSLKGSAVLVVTGLVIALWSGLRVIDAMQNAMNTVWDVPPVMRPNMVKRRGRSMLMLTVLGAGIVGSVVASSLATFLSFIPGVGRFGIFFASAAVSVLLYLVAFQVLTDRRIPWRDLGWGAVFGGLSWWALQTFGTPIVARSAENPTYGDFASIIALMTFFFLAAQFSIIGAELSAVRSRRLYPRSLIKGDLTVNDVRAFELLATSTQFDRSYEVRLMPTKSAPPALNDDPVLDKT